MEAEKVTKASGVKITACNVEGATNDMFPNVKVDLVINNTTKNQQTYFMDLFIKDEAGVRLANGSAMVTDVRPGQEVKHTETIHMTKTLKAGQKVSCSIDKVS